MQRSLLPNKEVSGNFFVKFNVEFCVERDYCCKTGLTVNVCDNNQFRNLVSYSAVHEDPSVLGSDAMSTDKVSSRQGVNTADGLNLR
jgi:hypothetical protein